MKYGGLFSTLMVAVTLTSSCTTGFHNSVLPRGASNLERRSVAPPAPDRPVILMAFSGGGARAAALAAAVLAKMDGVTYTASDGRHRLTDDITLVSSVSGGSVTAAWLGLYRGENLGERLAELKDRFLTQDNMGSLKGNLVNPLFWVREAFTDYSRIQALEELLDKRLFDGKQISEINQPGKPFVIFNASDMAGGETFAFTPSRFDDICSDFDSMRLSTAVAASAAFPIALTPVTFKDFQKDCPGNIRDARWAEIEQAAPQGQLNLAEYRNARYTNDLRQREPTFRSIKFIHLLDGGLADNLGINSIRDALSRGSDDTHLLQEINLGHVRKLVVIIVNARSDPPNELYQKQDASGLFGQLAAVTSAPIDANSLNAQQNIDRLLLEMARAAVEAPNTDIALQVYNVTVDFDTIAADTPGHRALRDVVKTIPTSWNIDADQLSTIDQASALILDNDGCYRQLLADLKATGGPQNPLSTGCKTRVTKPH